MIEISTLSICSGNIQLINNSDKSDGNTLLSSSQATEKNQKSQYLNVLNHETEKERKYVVIASKNIIQANNDKNNVKFEYKLKTHEIEITFDGCNGREKLSMKMLSDGLRSTISMVADIAYRMAVLNPQLLEHVLDETTGIVLIDEVDMHLHPEWQKRIMEDLHFIFPKVQFIVTTHAPSILANIQKEHILLFENYQVYKPINATYGRDISTILREMMKVEVRPDVITKLLDSFYHNLSVENYEEAKKELEKLEDILGDNDSDVVEAKISYDVEQI